MAALSYAVSMVERIGPKRPRQRAYIREHRKAKGWSQTELANRMETTKSSISRYETGARDYPGGFLAAVAEAMGMKEGELYRLPEPNGESIDELLQDKPELKKQVRAIAEMLLKTGS